MAKLPRKVDARKNEYLEAVASTIMRKLNDEEVTRGLRDHLGLSMIGNKCHRYLQYNHYHCFDVTHSARVIRLFGEGHRAEPVLKAELLKLGIVVEEDQDEVIGSAGHWIGHIDGAGDFYDMPRFLIEFKTHNEKSFKELKKLGVKDSKPVHYSQMTTYAGYKGYSVAMYVAINKNDSEIYIEFIKIDEDHFNDLKKKESEVLMADELLPRIGNNNATWFECKFCDAKDVCFGKKEIKANCRNCHFVDVLDNGAWECTKVNELLDDFTICNQYELGWMFR